MNDDDFDEYFDFWPEDDDDEETPETADGRPANLDGSPMLRFPSMEKRR